MQPLILGVLCVYVLLSLFCNIRDTRYQSVWLSRYMTSEVIVVLSVLLSHAKSVISARLLVMIKCCVGFLLFYIVFSH